MHLPADQSRRWPITCLYLCAALLCPVAAWATTPIPTGPALSISGQLSAQGSFVIPQPLTLSGQLSAQGEFVVPQPLVLQVTLSAQGNFTETLARPSQKPVSTQP